jgi:membrane-bound ClpP family serine protease
MFNFNRLLGNMMSAVAQEFNDAPNLDLNRVMPGIKAPSDMQEGIVTRKIQPGVVGQVQFRGTWWNARCDRDVTLMPGQVVFVMNRTGNTLYVEPGFVMRTMMPTLTVVPNSH